jgi:cation diffusion facilitator family transporter
MSDARGAIKLPDDKQASVEKAKRLEIWSLISLLVIVGVVGLAMGSSQAMKAMWIEDTLSLIPTTAVLVGIYFRKWEPDDRFPYGYRRAVQIGFLAAAVTLLGFGTYLLGSSIYELISAHHPTIQTIEISGHRIWLGWLMIGALIFAAIPPAILGYLKKPLAEELHDKTLYTSATIDKGDWMSSLAGIIGIVGIAYGYWWLDAAAAIFISGEIIMDGIENLINSVQQLMNMRPTDVRHKQKDPVYDRIKEAISSLPWVKDSQIRLREEGDVLFGEAFVVPGDEADLLTRLGEAGDKVKKLDWRIQDFNIVPVRSLGR